jgi:hypothetical protein
VHQHLGRVIRLWRSDCAARQDQESNCPRTNKVKTEDAGWELKHILAHESPSNGLPRAGS